MFCTSFFAFEFCFFAVVCFLLSKLRYFFSLNSFVFLFVINCSIIVLFFAIGMNKKVAFVALYTLYACALVAQNISRPLVVAHRGGAGEGLENTLSCIERSIAAGVDAVEIDVRLTADGHIVVCHDATVNSTTNGCGCISELTLQQVQALRVTDKMGVVTGESIPTLGQVLSLVNGRCSLLIEVKQGGRGIEELLVREVLEADAAGWVSVQSFKDDVLHRLYEMNVPFSLEKLIVFKIPFLPLVFDGSLRYFSFDKYSFVSSFNFKKSFFPVSLAKKIRSLGKKVKVWTLSGPSDAPPLEVDAVITDFPSLWLP